MATSTANRDWADSLVPGQFRHLFDHLPGTMFFAKDGRLRLMMGNPAFVHRCGFEREEQIVGLTDDQIFAPRLAAKYRRDDERVLRTGEPLLGLVELFPGRGGGAEWYVTDKLPLYGRDGRPAGVCGTVRSYEGQREALQPYLELAAVAEHLRARYREPLDAAALAALAGMSVRHFGRKFRATFGTTPRAFLMQVRVLRASELLETTDRPITEVALAAGFYDHSDLSRHFLRHMGTTPGAHRRQAVARARAAAKDAAIAGRSR